MIFGILGPNELSIVEKNFYRDLWLKIRNDRGAPANGHKKPISPNLFSKLINIKMFGLRGT